MKTDHSALICGVLSAINAVKPHSCQFTQETIKKATEHLESTQAGPYIKAMEALNLMYGSRNLQHSDAWKAGVELADKVLSGQHGVILCAVPDCDEKAKEKRAIAINGNPKEELPVCSMHADAADEDAEAGREQAKERGVLAERIATMLVDEHSLVKSRILKMF